MEKSCRKCAPKASPRPFFNFGEPALNQSSLSEVSTANILFFHLRLSNETEILHIAKLIN